MTVLLLLITMDVNNQVEQQYCQAMLIPIHTDSEIPEWAMIEVNGELIAPKECPDGKENPNGEESLIQRNRLELGSLRFVDEKPVLTVGSHELTGKQEKLKQTFCVLQKQVVDEDSISYQVTGVVTRKLLFNQYPKIIM